MTIKRTGRCATCNRPCAATKEFIVTIDMFNPTEEIKLNGELAKEVIAWRQEKLYCMRHSHEG